MLKLMSLLGWGTYAAVVAGPGDVFAASSPCQTPTAALDTTGRLGLIVDSIVRARMSERQITGAAVVVTVRGTVQKSTGYGLANAATSEPATPKTAFFVASIAKSVTSAAVLALVEAQQLRLDDSVGTILPGLPAAWHNVTLRHLLGMTAGLPDVTLKPGEYFADWATALDSLRGRFLLGRPGDAFQYVQTNYALLGKIVEVRTGRAFQEAVQTLVFHPLGIRSAIFGDWHDIGVGRAEWYSTRAPTGQFSAAPYILRTNYPEYVRPSSGLFISAEDLATFVDALAAGRFLGPESRALLWEPVVLADGTRSREGFGSWYTGDSTPPRPVYHEGGARAVIAHARDTKVTVVVLTTTQGGRPLGWIEDIRALYR